MASIRWKAYAPKTGTADRSATAKTFTRWSHNVVKRMAKYPAQNPNSRYVRTGTLGRNWQPRPLPDGAEVRNETAYASYVQGLDEDQVDSARNAGWERIDVVAQEEWDKVADGLQAAITHELDNVIR